MNRRIAAEKRNWESITPDLLINAVRHIRKRYEEKEFQFNYATEQQCFKDLHPVVPGNIASAVFKHYMDVCQEALKNAMRDQFGDLLQIGLTNAQMLSQNPVEWAKFQIEALITDKHYRVKMWIKNVCDKQELLKNPSSEEEMDEYFGWHSWRAPRLIHMQPSGNTPYDAATAWSRETQEETEKFLTGLSERFIDSLGFHLERLSGEAYVQLAKDGRKIQEPSAQKTPARTAEPHKSDTERADDSPLAFLSYSWDSESHKQWVLELASRLRTQGVRVILDRWDLPPGGDRTFFMEGSVSKSKFVVLICTPPYAKRANDREGGVGYEATIITGELAKNIRQGKFIPVLRDGDWDSALPIWIQTKLGVDLRDNPYSESQYDDLLRVLHDESLRPPPLGPKPALEQNRPSLHSARAPIHKTIAELRSVKVYSAEELHPLSSWPNVSLNCNWVAIQSTVPTNMREARNRTFLVTNENAETIYRVKLQDIPLSPFVVRFPEISFMSGHDKKDIYPIIFNAGDDSPLLKYDLEYCLAADSPCETGDYEEPSNPMKLKVLLTVRYFDKLGDCYEVPHFFIYDRYHQSAEVARAGGIQKIV
jgi:hypothetical protein